MTRGGQVTLTTAATDYNLRTLIAALASIVPADSYFPYSCSELTLQLEAVGPVSIKANGKIIGRLNNPGDGYTARLPKNGIYVGDYVLNADANSTIVNAMVVAR